MAQKINSISELKRALQNSASQALKMTQDEMFKVIQKFLSEYYHEPVFGDSSISKQYDRLYKMFNNIIKTDIVTSGNSISCSVEVDRNYLKYTGQEIGEYTNTKTHNGTVSSDVQIWNDAIEALGGKSGIMKLLKSNLKKCGVPIIN